MWGSYPRGTRIEVPLEPLPEDALRDHPAIIQNFARSILYDEPLIAPGEEGLAVVELINALILSGKRRCARLDPGGPRRL
jgi:predicted dehydrogenase